MLVNINPFYKTGLLLVMTAVIFQSACKKNDNTGSPVVTGVRAISPAPNDSLLTLVTPGQLVVIKGNNFSGVQQVFFDGYPASVNTALNTNQTMVITVPSTIIFTDVQPDAANTIKVITRSGSTVYKFPVVPPPPVINAITNEFAHAGDTITISGSYLYTVSAVVFPGNIPVTGGFTSAADGSSLKVIVPAGITAGDADSIAVETAGGTGKAAFNNTYGMLANFNWGDPRFGWQYWGGINSSDATAFPGGWGNYIEIKPSGTISAGDNSWYSNNRAVMVAASPWEGVNIADPPGNYALKFEMFVKDSWTNGSLMIAINGNFNWLARYAPWQQAPNGQFITSGWITVSIPLDRFPNGSSGSPASNVGILTGGSNGAAVQIMLYNDSTNPLTAFDAAFDNVRVVKIK